MTRLARGDTVSHRRYGYEPRPFDGEALDSLVERSVTRYRGQETNDADALAATFRGAVEAPAFHPPISRGRVAVDGWFWLRREDRPRVPHEWMLLEPDGEPVGVVELPRASDPLWMEGTVLWASVLDEYDVPWRVRYRIGA